MIIIEYVYLLSSPCSHRYRAQRSRCSSYRTRSHLTKLKRWSSAWLRVWWVDRLWWWGCVLHAANSRVWHSLTLWRVKMSKLPTCVSISYDWNLHLYLANSYIYSLPLPPSLPPSLLSSSLFSFPLLPILLLPPSLLSLVLEEQEQTAALKTQIEQLVQYIVTSTQHVVQ